MPLEVEIRVGHVGGGSKFGERVRAMSLSECARQAGISKTMLYQWLEGQRMLRLSVVQKLGDFIGLDVRMDGETLKITAKAK